MNIVLNCVSWGKEMRGVDRYANELLRALLKVDRANKYYIFVGSWQTYYDDFAVFPNARIIVAKCPSSRLFRNIWHAFVFPFQARYVRPDVVHLPNTMPLFIKPCPTVCTIHDLLEYTCPETFGFLQARLRKLIVRIETRIADAIIAVSDLSRHSMIDILRILDSKIRMIYSGVNSERFSVASRHKEEARGIFGLKNSYILFVGVLEKKKNLRGLITSYSLLPTHLKNQYSLVIAGKIDNAYAEARSLVEQLGLTSQVVFLGQVESNLNTLYQNASLFVLPSFYEGFGLPVLEAMASGVPVIASKNVAIAQRLTDCCGIIDPLDHQSMAREITRFLTNAGLRQRTITAALRRLKDFTWENSARQTLEVYYQAASRVKRDE